MISAVRAFAELINPIWNDMLYPRCGVTTCGTRRLRYHQQTESICNVARCGLTRLGEWHVYQGVYAGMIPVKIAPGTITAAVTELPGGPADPRQVYDVAFDNPAMTLHIIGDDLVELDDLADRITVAFDRTAHHDTAWGTVNGISIGPPKRTVRNDRPRYDLQLTIDMEMARA